MKQNNDKEGPGVMLLYIAICMGNVLKVQYTDRQQLILLALPPAEYDRLVNDGRLVNPIVGDRETGVGRLLPSSPTSFLVLTISSSQKFDFLPLSSGASRA